MNIQISPRGLGKTTLMLLAMIGNIADEFAEGKPFVEIGCNDPATLRKKLYYQVRKQKLLWGFAVCGNSVFVIK